MFYGNFSKEVHINGFSLVGFSDVPDVQVEIGVLFLLAYIIVVGGNIIIIVAVCRSSHLHTPMYFFLLNLSIIDIFSTSNILPKLLHMLFTSCHIISFAGCITQTYFFANMACAEVILLAVMAYDRYVAICHPLHYTVMVSLHQTASLSLATWIISFLLPIGHIFYIINMSFCASKIIDHFFCDVSPLLKIACSDTFSVEKLSYIEAIIVGFTCFLCTLISYLFIISAILKIKSAEGRKKAFSTCTSHLTCVMFFYGTLFCLHLKPSSMYSPLVDKFFTVVYVVLVPMANPFIYSLKNKDVKKALNNLKQNFFIKPFKANNLRFMAISVKHVTI
ncbi:olfactory receptor 1G1-like [Anomaloglossus baeobatrachus]|uniref:olfactory receptor 1G1-like n=1 Tax=Anomaloglossus baeobatrachus TaxID=238106 RepID=UPI003F503940